MSTAILHLVLFLLPNCQHSCRSLGARQPPVLLQSILYLRTARTPTGNAVFNYTLDSRYAQCWICRIDNRVPTRVIIADDSALVRGLIRNFLEKEIDVEVCAETGDGQQTIDAAVDLLPDLLILDVVMPKLNGIEVASILKKHLPNTKTIFFTMYGDYIKNVALAAGVSVIVSKPDGICALLDAVKALLD